MDEQLRAEVIASFRKRDAARQEAALAALDAASTAELAALLVDASLPASAVNPLLERYLARHGSLDRPLIDCAFRAAHQVSQGGHDEQVELSRIFDHLMGSAPWSDLVAAAKPKSVKGFLVEHIAMRFELAGVTDAEVDSLCDRLIALLVNDKTKKFALSVVELMFKRPAKLRAWLDEHAG